MSDIVERLERFASGGMGDVSQCCREAADEIKSLRKQFLDMACRILTQAQQTNAMVRDANSRIDEIKNRS